MSSHLYIFLSPHFDDVALSCGGLVHHLAQQGHTVEIWTIMGGFPPNQTFSEFAQHMHQEWGMSGEEVVRIRRGEDRAACDVMGAHPRHLDWPDAIYRKDPITGLSLVNNDEELFGKPPEPELVQEIKEMILNESPTGAKLVLPISLGNHIDHRAVNQAGTAVGRVVMYYADYPYVLKDFNNPENQREGWAKLSFSLNQSNLEAWQDAVLSFASQLSMFWRDKDEARLAIRNYFAGGGGRLWRIVSKVV